MLRNIAAADLLVIDIGYYHAAGKLDLWRLLSYELPIVGNGILAQALVMTHWLLPLANPLNVED